MTHHRDVEYHVYGPKGSRVFLSFAEASVWAMAYLCSGISVRMDVVIYSEAGAYAYGGREGLARYKANRTAPVFERFDIPCATSQVLPLPRRAA